MGIEDWSRGWNQSMGAHSKIILVGQLQQTTANARTEAGAAERERALTIHATIIPDQQSSEGGRRRREGAPRRPRAGRPRGDPLEVEPPHQDVERGAEDLEHHAHVLPAQEGREPPRAGLAGPGLCGAAARRAAPRALPAGEMG
eukprot:gene2246-biopygen7795